MCDMTNKERCVKCGAVLTQCPECKEYFYQNSKLQVYCRVRCRVRNHRKKLETKSPNEGAL